MSAIGTKRVLEAARSLGILIDGYARDVGRQLGQQLSPWLRDGETPPDFALVLQLPARRFRRMSQHLRERQVELDDARDLEAEARFQRKMTASALRRKLVDVRRLLALALGPERATKLLGVGGRTAQVSQPALLLSQAAAFSKLLRDPRRLTIPRARRFFTPAEVAGDVEAHADACRDACARLAEAGQETAKWLNRRDCARTALAHAVRSVVSLLRGWFEQLTRKDLIKKLPRVPRIKPA